jgi:cyclopropane fatty-acyl-phospholipid synthase-like methyltransferase
MTGYNTQYQVEENLFGAPYPEFAAFLKEHAHAGGSALDLGCGQGRDALLLAEYGYTVTGVDASQVGINQMLQRAQTANLAVKGVNADMHHYELAQCFDAIVLDSILHFGKADREKELILLDNVSAHLNLNGYLFLFIHKSPLKEKALRDWFAALGPHFKLVKDGYIDYVYEEKSTGFRSQSPFYMFIVKRVNSA